MSIDIETYRLKAQEAIEYVFVKEYHNSLGIPMPIVKMLLPMLIIQLGNTILL